MASTVIPHSVKSKNLLSLRREARATLPPDLHYHIGEIPAYHCGRSRLMNVEKALRSAAFLLDWSCDSGNEDVDGCLAFGISRVLDQATTEVAEMRCFLMTEAMRPVQRAAKSGRS